MSLYNFILKFLFHGLLISFCFIDKIQAQNDTTFFDANWQITSKEKAHYYRIYKMNSGKYLITDYYMNGNIQYVGHSKNLEDPLEIVDTNIWYYENGEREKLQFLSEANWGNGHEIHYYPNGQIADSVHFQDGYRQRIAVQYFPSGLLKTKLEVNQGLFNGIYENYAENGKIQYKGTAKNNLPEGKCYVYYPETGKVKEEFTIKNKRFEGLMLALSEEGDTVAKANFKNGIAQDFFVEYKHENFRVLKKIMKLVNGIEH